MASMYLPPLAVLAACLLSLSHTLATNSTFPVSSDGSCGAQANTTCLTSSYGDCCSNRGFCGSTSDFCSPTAGCQSSFGSCGTNTSFISYDGRCGSKDPNHQVCIGSQYGSCCSENGWCGTTTDYCGISCQSAYGTCGGTNITVDGSDDSIPSPSSSSASSSSTADNAAANSNSNNSSKSSIVTLEIAIAALGSLLAIATSIAVWYILKRRRRSREEPVMAAEQVIIEGKDCQCGRASIWEAPVDHNQTMIHISDWRALPAEIGGRYSRAELRERESQVYDTQSVNDIGRSRNEDSPD